MPHDRAENNLPLGTSLMEQSMKKSTTVTQQKACWYFRDRQGHSFGPYDNEEEIQSILKRNHVGKAFGPMEDGVRDFVMEDADHGEVCPTDWLAARSMARMAALRKKHLKQLGVYRCGPVTGISAHYAGCSG